MVPEVWPLVVYEKTNVQFEIVRKILSSPRVGCVICATDAGREGERIFCYIYEATGCSKPNSRLWISSLTPEAIRKGFDAIKPGQGLRIIGGSGTGAESSRLAGGHESFARLHAGVRRRWLRH
jgi:DNA topoisomerase-3